MRVAVFRARQDGLRTGEQLAALGHAAVLAPVIDLVRTGVPVPQSAADAVIFTSAHAPESLGNDPSRTWLARLPCWCVGQRTAAAARTLGFSAVEGDAKDGRHLAALIQGRYPQGARLLLLVGRDHKPYLPEQLRAAGFQTVVLPVYEATAVAGWSPREIAGVEACDAALHYSRRSADLAVQLAKAHGLDTAMRRLRHHCLSPDVAEALRPLHPAHLVCAEAPDEASLLDGLAGQV